MAPSYVTWQSAWHLARRHRSWRRARKYPQDTFLSACFFSVVFTYRKPPAAAAVRKSPPPRPSLWPPRPPSSGDGSCLPEVHRARPPRPPTSPGPGVTRTAPVLATARPARASRQRSATALPARHLPATAPAPAPAAPSPAAARPLPPGNFIFLIS
jgi:hypothetical protein